MIPIDTSILYILYNAGLPWYITFTIIEQCYITSAVNRYPLSVVHVYTCKSFRIIQLLLTSIDWVAIVNEITTSGSWWQIVFGNQYSCKRTSCLNTWWTTLMDIYCDWFKTVLDDWLIQGAYFPPVQDVRNKLWQDPPLIETQWDLLKDQTTGKIMVVSQTGVPQISQ